MSINPNRYPLDLTGTAVTNYIASELVTLNGKKLRVFSPRHAPFFLSGLIIRDLDKGQALTSDQFKPAYLVPAPSTLTGPTKGVYALVVITDQSVSNNLEIEYQTVGSDFVQGFDSLAVMFDALSADDRPVAWDNVFGKPPAFTPNQHLHPISNTFGWEFIITALQQLTQVMLYGDSVKKDFVLKAIDVALAESNAIAGAALSPTSDFGVHVNTPNAHNVTKETINLGNVQNFPIASLAEALAGIANDRYMTVELAAAAIHNAISGGIDAHILDHDNPHSITKMDLGLSLIQNFPIATVEQISTPGALDEAYVTNKALATWLFSYLDTQRAAFAAALSALTGVINNAATQADAAKIAANTAASQASAATTQAQNAVIAAQETLTKANQNTTEIQTSASAAAQLVADQLATAVAQARAAGYAQGFADGRAI